MRAARKGPTIAILAVLALALALRGVAVFDAFWLDEIWSWAWIYHPAVYVGELAPLKIHSALDIFTTLRHDNNHQLITLWIYLVGDLDQWAVYRLPSLLAGLGTVWLAMERRQGWPGVVYCGGLFATSYLAVVFSTEARGYGLAVFFALLGYRLLSLRQAEAWRIRTKDSLAYAAIVILGLSSHFIFAQFFAAALLWSTLHILRTLETKAALQQLARIHTIPLLYLLVLYFGYIRGMHFGGGASEGLGATLREVLAWTAGAPNAWWGALLGAGLLFALAVLGVRSRPRTDSWALLLGAVVIGPALPLLLRALKVDDATSTLYPRYFLIAASFVLLFAGRGLVHLHQRGRLPRIAALTILAALVFGNSARTVRFLQHGRGSYAAAVEFMAKNSLDQNRQRVDFAVGSRHAMRSKMTLLYYRRFLPAGQRVGWVDEPEKRPIGGTPRWLVLPHPWYEELPEQQRPPVEPMIQLPNGAVYRFAEDYPFYGPSGFSWRVYGRIR